MTVRIAKCHANEWQSNYCLRASGKPGSLHGQYPRPEASGNGSPFLTKRLRYLYGLEASNKGIATNGARTLLGAFGLTTRSKKLSTTFFLSKGIGPTLQPSGCLLCISWPHTALPMVRPIVAMRGLCHKVTPNFTKLSKCSLGKPNMLDFSQDMPIVVLDHAQAEILRYGLSCESTEEAQQNKPKSKCLLRKHPRSK